MHTYVREFRRRDQVIFGLLMAVLAVIAARYYAGNDRVLQVIFAAIVGVVTLTLGWGFGALAFAVPLIRVLMHPSNPEMLESIAECIIIYGTTGLARSAAHRLRVSQTKLRAVLAAMTDVILVLDRDGRYRDIAPADPSLLYRPAKELAGRTLSDVFDEQKAEFFLAHVRRAIDLRGTVFVDYMLEIGGTPKWFSAAVSPIGDDAVIWVARDITARKEAEEALQQSNVLLERRVDERTAELQRTIDALHEESRRRTAAEEALRASEAHHRRIVDQASEIIFTIDFAGIITSLNPAFEQITGWRCDDWTGRSLVGLLVPEEREEAAAAIMRARNRGGVSVKHATIRKPDGSSVLLEGSVVVHVIDGRQAGFLGFARDVTEREQAFEELRRSEQLLAESQRMAKLGSWDHDVESQLDRWSDQMYEFLGMEPGSEQAAFGTFVQFVVPEDRPRLVEMKESLGGGEARDLEVQLLLRDGSRKHVRISALAFSQENGRARVRGVVQDITLQKAAEAQLRETEERFHLLARATNDAVYDWYLGTNEVWWGEGHQKLFGYGPDEARHVGGWAELIHPDDRERTWTSLQTAMETGQDIWSEEYRYRRSDGTYAVVLDRAYIVRDATKTATRVAGSMTDMTERKHLQEQLAQAKRVSSLGRVAASIAHEFNNVLMGIQPNLEVIRRRGSEDLRAPIEHILQSVRRGKRVTDEILRFTRPGAPGLQCVSIAEFFDRWAAENRPILGSNVDLHLDIEHGLHMTVDPLQTAQVFTNLALNARDAMGENGGTLSVTASLATSFGSFSFGVVKSPDRYVHFRVTDNGCGMTREQLGHVFEPLFTTKKKGTGLGLAVSYQLVLQHEGYMFVESEIGRGSTFHVFLLAGSPVLRLVETDACSSLDVKRVLIVEDEVAVATGIRTLLELEEVTVEVVHTGREAIPAIERFRPDSVILDIGLPDANGADIYTQIASRWPDLPVLFSSGHADAAKLEPFLRASTTALLIKPYDFETLRASLLRLSAARPNQKLCNS